jgi:ribosomal protein S27AE
MAERKLEDEHIVERKLEGNEHFFSLVNPSTPRKKRRCLKCTVPFLSTGHSNRVCGSCAAQNNRAAIRAREVF